MPIFSQWLKQVVGIDEKSRDILSKRKVSDKPAGHFQVENLNERIILLSRFVKGKSRLF